MQQKPSSRRQQLLGQLSSVSGYKGIDSLSDLTIREQIEWILQRTNPRLRPAIATLVHAGERSGFSAYRRRKALIELLAAVYLQPVDHDAVVANDLWCARLATLDDRAPVRYAARRVMTEMFDRVLCGPDADSDHARLFVWAVDEGLASGGRVGDRELVVHSCCLLARSARHDGSVTTSMFWLDRADRVMATLNRPDPYQEVRIGGNRALTLAAPDQRPLAAAFAAEFSVRASWIGAERWEDRLRALLEELNEPSSWPSDNG